MASSGVRSTVGAYVAPRGLQMCSSGVEVFISSSAGYKQTWSKRFSPGQKHYDCLWNVRNCQQANDRVHQRRYVEQQQSQDGGHQQHHTRQHGEPHYVQPKGGQQHSRPADQQKHCGNQVYWREGKGDQQDRVQQRRFSEWQPQRSEHRGQNSGNPRLCVKQQVAEQLRQSQGRQPLPCVRRQGVQRRWVCERKTFATYFSPLPVHCTLRLASKSGAPCFWTGGDSLRSADVYQFSTISSERLTCELEKRLLQWKKSGAEIETLYDRHRQGIVLAIADDVLLVRGLAAATVGTVVAFTPGGAGDSSVEGFSAAGGDRGKPEVAESARFGRAVEIAEEDCTARSLHRAQKTNSVLGVVLQLLQQDLNVVGLLGGSSDFSVCSEESLPFRTPCVGDICTGVSAFDHQSTQLQQQRKGRRQPTQNIEKEDFHAQQRNQPLRQGEEQQHQSYGLIDGCMRTHNRQIASPMALLHGLAPVSVKGAQTLNACEPTAFFNVLDFSDVPVKKLSYKTTAEVPWALPTGSAVVDALAPLQFGEASAFIGPPGTGKTDALLPVVAVHAAASAVSDAPTDRALATAASNAPLVSGLHTETTSQPKLAVVFLSYGTARSALCSWLDALRKEIAVCSAAASHRLNAGIRGSASESTAPGRSASEADSLPSCALLFRRPCVKVGDPRAAAIPTPPAGVATSAAVLSPLSGVVVLHVPAGNAAAAEAGSSGAVAQRTDLHGYRFCQTSSLAYVAPILALRLSLEAQTAAATQGAPCPVLLVIDGLAMHAAAIQQLQQNIKRLLSSPSAAVHLPASVSSLNDSQKPAPLFQDAAAQRARAVQSDAVPFSPASFYAMLTCRTRKYASDGTLLSLLLVLDTPSDPALLNAGKSQRSMSSLSVQQQQLEDTLIRTIKGNESLGVVLSHKMVREIQEALLSTVHRTIFFAMGKQQQGQHSSIAYAAQKTVQQEQGRRQQKVNDRITTRYKRMNLFADLMYPMIDIDSVVGASTASLSAEACSALSQSCFSRSNKPAKDGASLETLREAVKALCRRQLRAEKQLVIPVSNGMFVNEAYVWKDTVRAMRDETVTAGAARQPVFEPPALLAAAAAAFAWQRRILHSESERHRLMQQFKLFVDVWEEEDLDSLSIASAVCLARPKGRIFSPTEQLLLLRAAAILFFTPARMDAPKEAEAPQGSASAGSEAAAPSGWSGRVTAGGARHRGLLSFKQICAFQEEMLQCFLEREPRLWEAVQEHLRRAGCRPLHQTGDALEDASTRVGLNAWGSPHMKGKNLKTSFLQTAAEEEEQVKHLAQEVMYLLSRVDAALLSMRHCFNITAPYFF